MPRLPIGSYDALINKHLEHWQSVNADAGAPPGGLVLPGPYGIAQMEAQAAELYEAARHVIACTNAHEEAVGRRAALKRAMLRRLAQFRAAVRALVPDEAYVAALPLLPDFTSADSKFLAPFHKAGELWMQIDSSTGMADFTPPLALPGYVRADLQADAEALEALGIEARRTREATMIARRQREELLAKAKRRLKQYRLAVVAVLGPDHALVRALPRLSPRAAARPPLELSASWDAEAGEACLAWPGSPNRRLDHYSVRACAGEKYSRRKEFEVGGVAKEETTFRTDAGLSTPGAVVSFRVYAVTTKGYERGSTTAVVRREA